jgi:hypothetical protein
MGLLGGATLTFCLVAAALGTQAWQVFGLGYHHDDWSLFVYPHVVGKLDLGAQPDRLGYIWLSEFILAVWDGDAATFRLISLAANLITAFSIGWLVLSIQGLYRTSSITFAIGTAAIWLIAPWGLGYTAWPTVSFEDTALALFCFSMVALLQWLKRRRLPMLILLIALFAASISIYQSTWCAFVPVFLLLLLHFREDRMILSRLALPFSLLSITQGLFALQSALYSPKQIAPKIWILVFHNIVDIFAIPIGQFGRMGTFLGAIAITSVIVAASRERGWRRTIEVALMCLSGMLGSAVLYAVANYGFSSVGNMSRTTAIVTFWSMLLVGVLFAGPPGETGYAPAVRQAIVGMILVGCLVGYLRAARPWAESWRLQQEILARLSNSNHFIDKLQPGDAVLCDVQMLVDNITVFGAPWDTTAAVLVASAKRRPDLVRTPPPIAFVPPYPWKMSWVPGVLTIAPGWTFMAKRLWLWSVKSARAALVRAPIEVTTATFPKQLDEAFRRCGEQC